MVLPVSARRKGGAVPIGYLAALVAMISTMLSLGAASHVQALAIGLQLPKTPLSPVLSAASNVTSQLPVVPVTITSTPGTVGATVDPSLPIVSSPAAAPIQVSVPLPVTSSAIVPAASSSAQPQPAPVTHQAAAKDTVASNTTVPANSIVTASQSTKQVAAIPSTISPVRSAVRSTPSLGITGFMNSVPAALQNLARGLAGGAVDNFAYIIMADFVIAMLALSAGLAGVRYQTNRTRS